jgi:hypothetical protein
VETRKYVIHQDVWSRGEISTVPESTSTPLCPSATSDHASQDTRTIEKMVVSEFVVASSLWLEIGAERRLYNSQIRTLPKKLVGD